MEMSCSKWNINCCCSRIGLPLFKYLESLQFYLFVPLIYHEYSGNICARSDLEVNDHDSNASCATSTA